MRGFFVVDCCHGGFQRNLFGVVFVPFKLNQEENTIKVEDSICLTHSPKLLLLRKTSLVADVLLLGCNDALLVSVNEIATIKR